MPVFTVPFFPFFRRPKISPTVPFLFAALTDGKMGIFAAQQHSPPRRLVRLLSTGASKGPHRP